MPWIPDDPNDPNHGAPADPDGVGRATVVALVLWFGLITLAWFLFRP